jgi:hypothetical protein
MAIPNIPVWSIAPNWKTAVTEHLEWLTDVLIGSNGNEQRRGLRLSPRRSFELTFNPIGRTRSFFELCLHRQGGIEWFLPLFHDKGRLSAQAVAGSSVLAFDNRWREFEAGGYAILLGRDAFSYEVVEIESVDDAGLTLADPLTRTWSRGMPVYPLRTARLDQESVVTALTRTVGEASLLWQLTGANDYAAEIDTGLEYEGRAVILNEPNRERGLDLSLARMLFRRDNETGRVHVRDDAGRAFTSQVHDWMVVGREPRHKLRSMLYALNGRQVSVWLPTFNADVVLSRPAVAGANRIVIQKIGLDYLGGIGSGRDHILLGGQVLRITGTEAPPSDDEEKLVLAAPLAGNRAVGASGSFLDAARMDQESVEITHHADSDGAMEASTAFRTFRDDRDPSGTIYLPIPASVMSSTPCGVPGDSSPCAPIFTGPFLSIFFRCYPYGPTVPNTRPAGWVYASKAEQVYPPLGRFVAGTGTNFEEHEYGTELDPIVQQGNLRGQTLVTSNFLMGNGAWHFFYPFYGEVYGDGINFEVQTQFPAGSKFTDPDGNQLEYCYQWFDMKNPSAWTGLGWIGSLWPTNYQFSIPNHTFGYEAEEFIV